MKLRKYHYALTVALIAGALLSIGCGEDEATAPNDVPTVCTRELCANNTTLRNECVQEYNTCLATGESSEDCAVLAGTTCNVL